MFHRFYCLAQHHRESTHTSYLDQILNELSDRCGQRLNFCSSELPIIGGLFSDVNFNCKLNLSCDVRPMSGARILHPHCSMSNKITVYFYADYCADYRDDQRSDQHLWEISKLVV